MGQSLPLLTFKATSAVPRKRSAGGVFPKYPDIKANASRERLNVWFTFGPLPDSLSSVFSFGLVTALCRADPEVQNRKSHGQPFASLIKSLTAWNRPALFLMAAFA